MEELLEELLEKFNAIQAQKSVGKRFELIQIKFVEKGANENCPDGKEKVWYCDATTKECYFKCE